MEWRSFNHTDQFWIIVLYLCYKILHENAVTIEKHFWSIHIMSMVTFFSEFKFANPQHVKCIVTFHLGLNIQLGLTMVNKFWGNYKTKICGLIRSVVDTLTFVMKYFRLKATLITSFTSICLPINPGLYTLPWVVWV